ncbi:hypothetical protein FACS189421_03050 [Bacteroidia bacterium]|nr:hypothetical protein FACS189421_03050 [Bacteroidia bacterium]
MNNQFHTNLNRMALFAALIAAGVILGFGEIMRIAMANIWLNGIIIGTTLFGIGLAFANIFQLVPEYRWMKRFFTGKAKARELPPRILRSVAILLNAAKVSHSSKLSAQTVSSSFDMILGRFEDMRESVRYITNILIFLGLLGTFWGLIHTVGGFADLVGGLNFEDVDIMVSVQHGLAMPLSGMGMAFASSLFGLAGSLIVGFLGLQVQLAQNAMFRELEEKLSGLTQDDQVTALTNVVAKLEKTIGRMAPKS